MNSNFRIQITLFIVLFTGIGLILTVLNKEEPIKPKQITTSDISSWEVSKHPDEAMKAEMNKWIGEHPNANVYDFYDFTEKLEAKNQRKKIIATYPNAAKLRIENID